MVYYITGILLKDSSQKVANWMMMMRKGNCFKRGTKFNIGNIVLSFRITLCGGSVEQFAEIFTTRVYSLSCSYVVEV